MPALNEWEKSKKLTSDLRKDIISASLEFCFKPLSEIFEELYIQLAWDLYFLQTPPDLYTLYTENQELIGHLIEASFSFSIIDIEALPIFDRGHYNSYQRQTPSFPIKLPLLSKNGRRNNKHTLTAPEEGTNKKERAIYARYKQLKKDINIFSKKVAVFNKELIIALDICNTTKQFIEQNPEFEGYMKQSLKKFYNNKHPNVIDSLNSAMDVRKYASLTFGHRLQAYQQKMLSQLVHTPIFKVPQA